MQINPPINRAKIRRKKKDKKIKSPITLVGFVSKRQKVQIEKTRVEINKRPGSWSRSSNYFTIYFSD